MAESSARCRTVQMPFGSLLVSRERSSPEVGGGSQGTSTFFSENHSAISVRRHVGNGSGKSGRVVILLA